MIFTRILGTIVRRRAVQAVASGASATRASALGWPTYANHFVIPQSISLTDASWLLIFNLDAMLHAGNALATLTILTTKPLLHRLH